MGTKIFCIYHSRDLDGWMSAAIIESVFPEATFIGWDYGDKIPDWIPDSCYVVMVDVSFPLEVMKGMLDRGISVTWIDHHESAIKANKSILPRLEGMWETGRAACELAWEYYYPEPMPELVRLLGAYDSFSHKGTEEEQYVLEFQYGARAHMKNRIDTFLYLENYFKRPEDHRAVIKTIHGDGVPVYYYLQSEAAGIYDQRFEIILDGYKFGCVNRERFNPVNFGIDYHKDGLDGFACFWYQNGQFTYSLYNDNGEVDCSLIAKKRGGGGHKGAAGFRTKKIIV